MNQRTIKPIILGGFWILFGPNAAFSQQNIEKWPQKFQFLQLGLLQSKTKDQLGSPLLYVGNGVGIEAGRLKISEKWQRTFQFSPQVATIKNKISGTGEAQSGLQFFVKFSETVLRKTHFSSHKWPLSLGGQVSFETLVNLFKSLPNNAFLYRMNVNLAPAASISHTWSGKKRDWIFSADLAIPLIGFSVRPGYLGVGSNQLSGNTAFLGDLGHFSSFHNQFGFDYQLKIDRPLANGNRFRLAYRGLLFSDKTNKSGKVQFASSMLHAGFLFNIPSKNHN